MDRNRSWDGVLVESLDIHELCHLQHRELRRRMPLRIASMPSVCFNPVY